MIHYSLEVRKRHDLLDIQQLQSSSYGGMNNGLYSGALQMLSSTAAALVDKDQFSNKRYADDFSLQNVKQHVSAVLPAILPQTDTCCI
jgi:hypothetical protein